MYVVGSEWVRGVRACIIIQCSRPYASNTQEIASLNYVFYFPNEMGRYVADNIQSVVVAVGVVCSFSTSARNIDFFTVISISGLTFILMCLFFSPMTSDL